jgi:hypothetical protein
MADEYEINEEDITKVLNYLELTDRTHASRDMAIAVLNYMHSTMNEMSFDNPEQLDQIIEDMKKK